jgi:hypothetical protein
MNSVRSSLLISWRAKEKKRKEKKRKEKKKIEKEKFHYFRASKSWKTSNLS